MAASVRAHANLNLFLAEKAIAGFKSGAFEDFWGEHAEMLALDTALFRLQLAYRCHLTDICEQRQITTLRPRNAAEAAEAIAKQNEVVPEIQELAEREKILPWLSLLLSENFLPGAEAVKASASDTENLDMIARSDGGDRIRSPQMLDLMLTELKELIVRHRETQQEY